MNPTPQGNPTEVDGHLRDGAVRLSGYFAGQLGIKVLYLLGIILATRATGPVGWGQLTAILAVGSILVVGVDLGFNPYVTREVAALRPLRSLFLAGSRYRLLGTVAFVVLFPVVVASTLTNSQQWVVLLLTWFLVSDSWAKYLFALQRGAEVTRYEILGGNLEKACFAAISAVAVLIAVKGEAPGSAVLLVAAAFGSGATIKLVVALVSTRRVLRHALMPLRHVAGTFLRRRAWARDMKHLRNSADFLFMALFSTIYFRIDAYMIAAMAGNLEAGYYGAAYRLVEGLMFVPEGVLVIFSPLLVRLLQHRDVGALTRSVERIAGTLVAIGATVVFFLASESRFLVTTVYGHDYVPSESLLLALAPAYGLMCVNFLLGGLLTAGYRQRSLLLVAMAGAVVNVAANLVLIPRFGAEGATYATVGTEGLVAFGMLIGVRHLVPLKSLLKPLILVATVFGVILVLPRSYIYGNLDPWMRVMIGVSITACVFLLLARFKMVATFFGVRSAARLDNS